MSIEMDIVVPEVAPVITLPGVALFPQAMLPLHIFESRYRLMLTDVLAGDRLMVVAGLNGAVSSDFEPPFRVASLGIVRACQKFPNGTSNLLLQGIVRVKLGAILKEDPYRTVAISALPCPTPTMDDSFAGQIRENLQQLIKIKERLDGTNEGEGFLEFLRTVEDPEVMVDLAAFNFCSDSGLKQRLLETLNLNERLLLLRRHLRAEIVDLRLRHRLQGKLADEDIGAN